MAGPGRFITLEGIDGSGKSTALRWLISQLQLRGIKSVATREPGGTPLAERLRKLLLRKPLKGEGSGKGTWEAEGATEMPEVDTELLLVFAARIQHVETVIRPALEAGVWVICDRFTDATYAYQGGGRGVSAERIRLLEEWVRSESKAVQQRKELGYDPDRTLLFDVPIAEGMRRRARRGPSEEVLQGRVLEREGEAFLSRVRRAYSARAAAAPKRFCWIDAGQTWPEVAAELARWLEREVFSWRTGD